VDDLFTEEEANSATK